MVDRLLRTLALAWLLGAAGLAPAADAPPVAADPAVEARMLRITAELRCLVCQNQSVAESHADLAGDLREEVRELIRKGASDADIRAFMVARYGDFVLYRPPVRSTTVLLWAGPLVLLVAGLVVLVAVLRRRAALPPEAFEPDPGEGPEAAVGDRP